METNYENTLIQKQQKIIEFQTNKIKELENKNTQLEIDLKIIQEGNEKLLGELHIMLKKFKLASEIGKQNLISSYENLTNIKQSLKDITSEKENITNEFENSLKDLYKATGVQEMLEEKKKHDDYNNRLNKVLEKQRKE